MYIKSAQYDIVLICSADPLFIGLPCTQGGAAANPPQDEMYYNIKEEDQSNTAAKPAKPPKPGVSLFHCARIISKMFGKCYIEIRIL